MSAGGDGLRRVPGLQEVYLGRGYGEVVRRGRRLARQKGLSCWRMGLPLVVGERSVLCFNVTVCVLVTLILTGVLMDDVALVLQR